jgi:hypothetical protein
VVATENSLLVGAIAVANWSGAVYVFEKNSSNMYEQLDKLVARDGAEDDFFGRFIAAAGSVVVVGASGTDDKGSRSGSAYVFERSDAGQYEQVSKLVASDGAADDTFGSAVATTADGLVVVGARLKDDARGTAYVFEKNNTGQYEQVSKLMASDGVAGR